MSEWIEYHSDRADKAEAEAARLREALLQMRGFLKLWSDDAAAGLKPTDGSLSDAWHLMAVTLRSGKQ